MSYNRAAGWTPQQLPEFKLGINGIGVNQALLQRDLTKYQYSAQTQFQTKQLIVPNQPEPNVFFTPIEDNREQILNKMRKELDDKLEFTRTHLPDRR